MTLERHPASPDVLLAHAAWVRQLSRSLVLDENDAADVEQQTWLSALESPPRDGRAPRAWLGTVLRNWVRRRHRGDERRTRRERARATYETAPQPSAADVAARAEAHRNVVREVLALDEPYRSTVLRRYFDEVSARDIAAEQGLPLETVKTRLKRALKQLRGRLGPAERRDARRALLLLAGLSALPQREAGSTAMALTVVQKTVIGLALVVLVVLLASALREDDGAPQPVRDRPAAPADAAPAPEASQPSVPAPEPRVEPAPTPARVTTTTVRVRVRDEQSGALLTGFRCSLALDGAGPLSAATDAGVLERALDLGAAPEAQLVVEVTEPPPAEGSGRRTVAVAPGETTDVEIAFRPRAGTSGTVVGPDGRPVVGALVFYGNQIRARGDEPFKPFRPGRIVDGVETDEQGRFHLDGPALVRRDLGGGARLEVRAQVTVLHPGYSAVSMAADAAARVQLQPRGAIRGRLLDGAGNPVSEGEIALDRAERVQLGEDGGFAFPSAHGGVRGLVLPGRRYVGVVVEPGATREVELGGWIPRVTVALGPLSEQVEGRGTAVFIGRGDVFSMHLARIGGATETQLTDVLPGRFLLLVEGGRVGFVDVGGAAATLEPATGDLTVTAPPGARVYLVPRGANEFEKLMGGRVASRTVPTSGTVRFDLLPAGGYEVGVDRLGTFVEAQVDGPGATVELRLR